MKKYLLLLLLLSLTLTGTAQSRVGHFTITPKLGVAIANLTDNSLATSDGNYMESKYRAGITAGVEGSYMATDYLRLALGVNYSTLGSHYKNFSEEVSASSSIQEYEGYSDYYTLLGYVQVPLTASYYVFNGLAVKAGLQPAFLVHAKTSYDMRPFTVDTSSEQITYGDVTSYKETGTDGYKKFELSIPIGVSYEYMNVLLDFQYNIPLTKVSENTDSKNKAFQVTVGYRFDL